MERELGGADVDTRRRSAATLLRALCAYFEPQVTSVCLAWIGKEMTLFSSNPSANWRNKDTAIVLASALATRSTISAAGTVEVNSLVNVQQILIDHVIPAIADPNGNAILQSDSIKFALSFRGVVSADAIRATVPVLVQQLGNKNQVVHTFAAFALDRIMSIKGQNKMTPEAIGGLATADKILESLFAIFVINGQEARKVAENSYAMQCTSMSFCDWTLTGFLQ